MSKVDLITKEEIDEKYKYLLSDDAMGEINLLCAMGNNPDLLQSYMRYGSILWKESGLNSREVELVILSIASSIGAKYEWQQHVPIALEMGIEKETIQSLAVGEFEDLMDKEQAIIEYSIAVARGTDIESEFDELIKYVNEKTIVGVTLLSTHYLATARFLSALSIPLEKIFIGWDLSKLS